MPTGDVLTLLLVGPGLLAFTTLMFWVSNLMEGPKLITLPPPAPADAIMKILQDKYGLTYGTMTVWEPTSGDLNSKYKCEWHPTKKQPYPAAPDYVDDYWPTFTTYFEPETQTFDPDPSMWAWEHPKPEHYIYGTPMKEALKGQESKAIWWDEGGEEKPKVHIATEKKTPLLEKAMKEKMLMATASPPVLSSSGDDHLWKYWSNNNIVSSGPTYNHLKAAADYFKSSDSKGYNIFTAFDPMEHVHKDPEAHLSAKQKAANEKFAQELEEWLS